MNKIKIALFGYGVVGSGVKTIIDSIKDKYNLELYKVFDIIEKKDCLGELLETDENKIIENKEIDIIIECLGGDTKAYEIIKKALMKHKHVITSNKETVSKHLKEYLKLSQENGVFFLFEASVCGTIPIISNIENIIKFDEIREIKGIANGTCNYILSRIQLDGLSFDEALKEAQEKGLCEKDPLADLKGLDMVRKGIILSSLAYQRFVDEREAPCFGIEALNNEILSSIKEEDRVLRFGLISKLNQDSLSLMVIPLLYNRKSLNSNLVGANNSVSLSCKYEGTLSFIGLGASSIPTASAIISDLIKILDKVSVNYGIRDEELKVVPDFNGRYLVFDKDNNKYILTRPSQEELMKYPFVSLIMED